MASWLFSDFNPIESYWTIRKELYMLFKSRINTVLICSNFKLIKLQKYCDLKILFAGSNYMLDLVFYSNLFHSILKKKRKIFQFRINICRSKNIFNQPPMWILIVLLSVKASVRLKTAKIIRPIFIIWKSIQQQSSTISCTQQGPTYFLSIRLITCQVNEDIVHIYLN